MCFLNGVVKVSEGVYPCGATRVERLMQGCATHLAVGTGVSQGSRPEDENGTVR